MWVLGIFVFFGISLHLYMDTLVVSAVSMCLPTVISDMGTWEDLACHCLTGHCVRCSDLRWHDLIFQGCTNYFELVESRELLKFSMESLVIGLQSYRSSCIHLLQLQAPRLCHWSGQVCGRSHFDHWHQAQLEGLSCEELKSMLDSIKLHFKLRWACERVKVNLC